MSRRRTERRRGFALLTVVVAVSGALLVALTMIVRAHSEHAGRAASFDAAKRRAAAWSAAQAITALLGAQREVVLAGGAPTLRDQLPLYEDGPRAVLARMLPASSQGDRIMGESALLDANGADADALTIAGFDDEVIALIESARSRAAGGRLASLEEIIDQDRADPRLLRGADAFAADALAVLHGAKGDERGRALTGAGSALRDAGRALDDAGSRLSRGAGGGATARSTEPGAAAADPTGAASAGTPASADAASAGDDHSVNAIGAGAPALADRITVHSTEPSIARDGTPRLELDGEWVDALRELLGADVTPEVAKRLEKLAKAHELIESDEVLVECLHQMGIPPKAWGEVLDRVTTERGLWLQGRVDVNRAPPEVLLALPGLTADQVGRIVRERDGLDANERATPAWLVSRGIVEPEEFAALVSRVTARSWFWRVRYVVGFADADHLDGPLAAPTIWECVIDLTEERARIASIRDLTLAPISLRLLTERIELAKDEHAAPNHAGSEGAAASLAERGSRLDGAGAALTGAGMGHVDGQVPTMDADEASEAISDPESSGATPPQGAGPEESASSKDADAARHRGAPRVRQVTGAASDRAPGAGAGDSTEDDRSSSGSARGERAVASPGKPAARPPVGRFRPR